MAIGTGSLLRSDSLKNYTPLGEEGNPVYKWATQIRVAIRRNIGAENINVFAIPQINEDGDILDWYAPESGSVVPWSSATEDEQISAKEQLAEIQQKLLATENKKEKSADKEQTVFKRLLKHVIQFPDDQHVYLVNGKPVLTFWGFVNINSAPSIDPLTLLRIPELPKPADIVSIPVHDTVVETLPVKRRSLWWWLLLLPLLLLLSFFLLRSCHVLPPSINLGGISLPDGSLNIDPSLDIDPSIDISTGNRQSVGNIDGNLSAGSIEIAEGMLPELTPEEISEQALELDEKVLEQQPEITSEPKEENPENIPPVPENKPDLDSTQSQQQPLEIPKNSAGNKSLDFLNGSWQANSGLMDAQGRPVNLEYDFKDGKGNVRIRKNDGTVCTGKVEASMVNSKLGFSDTGKIKCPDGKAFQPAKVQCEVNSANKTVCEGSYKNGAKFNMDVTKSAQAEK